MWIFIARRTMLTAVLGLALGASLVSSSPFPLSNSSSKIVNSTGVLNATSTAVYLGSFSGSSLSSDIISVMKSSADQGNSATPTFSLPSSKFVTGPRSSSATPVTTTSNLSASNTTDPRDSVNNAAITSNSSSSQRMSAASPMPPSRANITNSNGLNTDSKVTNAISTSSPISQATATPFLDVSTKGTWSNSSMATLYIMTSISKNLQLSNGTTFSNASISQPLYGNISNSSIPTSVTESQAVSRLPLFQADVSPTSTPKAKKVFAHYLLGTVTQEHAQQDIDDAIAMGLDGFALNIGDPSQPFVSVSLDNLIGYAEYRGFSFFISLDVYASGNACYDGSSGACGGPTAYNTILTDKLGSSSWYKGPNGKPMISTYSSGGETNDTWAAWRQHFAQDMYFIPDFDETLGYYDANPGWWEYWGNIVDGLFSWEAAWPYRSGYGGQYPGDISPDLPVLDAATANEKGYMMALSSLQYKDAYGANVYRAGDLNLPTRMENILGMSESPDFIQVITWNDGPEAHYIGNLWFEQNNDSLPYRYANAIDWDHSGWRPLITSFIKAWKNNQPASEMAPPDGSPAIGALWYKTILQSSTCPPSGNAITANYSLPPDGFDTGTDQLNWAVVIEPGATGYSLNAYSNGVELGAVDLVPGLNYGKFSGVQAGWQQLFLWNNGALVLSATTGRCVSAGCPDCIYNMNLQVVALAPDTGTVGTCPYAVCEKKVFAHYLVGNTYQDHVQKDIDNAAAMGFDGFALNVGDPTQYYVTSTFEYMFDYTSQNYPDFHLFVSMDLWAEGNAFNGVEIDQYHTILADYKGHPAYLQGPDGNSLISSFSSGGLHDTDWVAWRNTWNNEVYLIPDFDDTAGYNTSDPGWWAYWGDIVQGAFSWETTWPLPGVTVTADDYSVDQVVVDGTFQHLKSYMMPLSPLQYKDSYNTNYFRGGNLNLPERMIAILNLNPTPDFVEYLTWNDGPESHYIGNLWYEQNNDTQPGLYSNSNMSHTAWQPLITSFISAFKASLSPADMLPPNGNVAVGAMWYNSLMTTSSCAYEYLGSYFVKPDGFDTATDWLNFAVVVDPTLENSYLQAISNGEVLPQRITVEPGLNYGYFDGISTGYQSIQLVSSSGDAVLTAAGGRCISDGCPDCVYNLNPVVVGFSSDDAGDGECYQQDCSAILSSIGISTGSGPGSGSSALIVYIDQIIYVEPSPILQCSPPCTLVLPSLTLDSETTIDFPPVTTSLVVGTSTFLTITPTPVTTSVLSFFAISVPESETSFTLALTSSFEPPPLVITVGIITTTVYFLPVTAPEPEVGVPTSAITVYTLPTTVYTSNGVTQTFSEAQFTNLRSLTSPTTSMTTFTEILTEGASSTTTSGFPVLVWINTHGLYWSPVFPRSTDNPPNPPAPSILSIPEFPPVPSVPCFKLFGIFSIDCPPDRSIPTTTFLVGAPEPTCTANCGSLCTLNCDTTGTASSPSTEESSSTSCSATGVTDYWLWCSTSSCSTIASTITSGTDCSATGTTTTFSCSVNPQTISFTSWWTAQDQFLPRLGIDVGYVTALPTTTSSASPTPTPSPTSASPTTTNLGPPEATCSVKGNLDSENAVVHTNFITDGGAAFSAALDSSCAVAVTNFQVQTGITIITDANGDGWFANDEFTFNLGLIRASAELECINRAIASVAPSNVINPTCTFTQLDDDIAMGLSNSSSSVLGNSSSSLIAEDDNSSSGNGEGSVSLKRWLLRPVEGVRRLWRKARGLKGDF